MATSCSDSDGWKSRMYPCICGKGMPGMSAPDTCKAGQVCYAMVGFDGTPSSECQDEHHVAVYKKMVFDLLALLILLLVYRQFAKLKLKKPPSFREWQKEQKDKGVSSAQATRQKYEEDQDKVIADEKDCEKKGLNAIAYKVQMALHRPVEKDGEVHINPVTGFLGQWYAILYIIMFSLALWNFANVFFVDYQNTHWLSAEATNRTMHETDPNMTYFTKDKIEKLSLEGHTVLRWMSLAAPIAGLIGFICLFIHFGMDASVVFYYHRDGQGRKLFPWNCGSRSEMVMVMIAVPGLYLVMAIRSVTRMWMVMRGYHKGNEALTDLALFDENFALAEVCLYFAVGLFANLCLMILEDSNPIPDVLKAMKYVGFQGLWGWVILGSFQSCAEFFVAYVTNHPGHCFDNRPGHTEEHMDLFHGQCLGDQRGISIAQINHIKEHFMPKLGTVVSVLSLVATYNMLVVCKLEFIENAMKKSNLKFLGTKALLLVAPNQLKILNLFILDGTWGRTCEQKLHLSGEKLSKCKALGDIFGLSVERAKLLHASLLCFECTIIILINFLFWKPRPFVQVPKPGPGDDTFKSTQSTASGSGTVSMGGMQFFLQKEYRVKDMQTDRKNSDMSALSVPLLA